MATSVNRKVKITIDGKEMDNTIKSLRAEMQKLKNEQAKMTIGTDEYLHK